MKSRGILEMERTKLDDITALILSHIHMQYVLTITFNGLTKHVVEWFRAQVSFIDTCFLCVQYQFSPVARHSQGVKLRNG